MAQINSQPLIINLITLGNSTVGKSCFIYKYARNEFRSRFVSTIGVDFLAKNIKLPSGQNVTIKFQDTAGQERYRSLAFNFVKMADGILLMYDITNMETFESISGWVESIKEIKGNDFPIILIGNKCDLNEKRKVSKIEGEKKAEENGFLFIETSCKDNINIEKAVNTIVNKITQGRIQLKSENQSIKLDKKKLKKHKRKCKC